MPTFEDDMYYRRQIGLVGETILFSRERDGEVELEIEYPDRTDLDRNGTSDMYITISAEDWATIVEYVALRDDDAEQEATPSRNAPVAGPLIPAPICGRLLVGQGKGHPDPVCQSPMGHAGLCDSHRLAG